MRYFLSWIGVVLFFCSCTTTGVEPTRTSRHTIDTLFHHRISVIKLDMDSMCKILHADIYRKAVDSLMAVRKQEMNLLVE